MRMFALCGSQKSYTVSALWEGFTAMLKKSRLSLSHLQICLRRFRVGQNAIEDIDILEALTNPCRKVRNHGMSLSEGQHSNPKSSPLNSHGVSNKNHPIPRPGVMLRRETSSTWARREPRWYHEGGGCSHHTSWASELRTWDSESSKVKQDQS
jgi:hypothetical protein